MTSTARSLLSLTCAVVALAASATAATAADEPATGPANDLNTSIVRITVTFDAAVDVPWQDGTSTRYSTSVGSGCTGFFVSDRGDIATAGHCVETSSVDVTSAIANVLVDLQAEGIDVSGLEASALTWPVAFSSPTAYVMQPSGIADAVLDDDWMVAQVVDYQEFESGDNALLRVADLTGTPALPISDQTPVVGDEVVSIGFPGSVSDVSDAQRQLPSYKSGKVSSRQYSPTGVPNTEIDAAVSQGMSGGPTVDAQGDVIGINSFGINGESQSFNFVTDTQTLRDFLTRNGVELTAGGDVTEQPGDGGGTVPMPEANPTEQREQGGASPLIWVLGLGVVLLLGALIMVATRSQRAATRTPAPQPIYPVASASYLSPEQPSTPAAPTSTWPTRDTEQNAPSWPAQSPEHYQPVGAAAQEAQGGRPVR